MVPDAVPTNVAVRAPSPLVGEGGRRPDEGDRRTQLARTLRKRATEAEERLWQLLRHRRLADFKFRRQVPIGPYVADFACFKAKLVIELDGSRHLGSARDVVRDAQLERRGFRVFRFWNSQLNDEPEAVLNAIWFGLQGNREDPSSALRAPSPTRGEGDGADGAGGRATEASEATLSWSSSHNQNAPSFALRAPSSTRGEGDGADAPEGDDD